MLFRSLSKALANIEEAKENIFGFVNIVITKYNFDFLSEIIEFIGRCKKIKQVLVSNFAPEGNGLSNFNELVVPLLRIKEKVGDIVSQTENQSIAVRFFGVPLCVLSGYWDYSNDVYWSPRATIEQWETNKKIFLKKRSEEHTSELRHTDISRMPSSA